MKQIIFWGATGQALVLYDFLESQKYKLIALFDKNGSLKSPVKDIPLFHSQHFEEWLQNKRGPLYFAIAIGSVSGNEKIQLHNYLKSKQLLPTTLIHPSATVSSRVHISDGCQILSNAVIVTHVSLGKECIINTQASVDHECILGDGVHVAPGATLAGCVTVGDYSFVGAGAVVLPRITIGNNVTVGAGSVVTKNIPDNVVVYGNPARITKEKMASN